MASQPSPPSVSAASGCSYEQKCVVLVDWWLERVDGKICIAGLIEKRQIRNGVSASQGSKRSATRVFKCAVTERCDCSTVQTENGYVVWIKGMLNKSRMRENGFSEQVCQSFLCGFPIQWNKLVDSNMEHTDEHPESPSNSADNALVEYYVEKFMSDNFLNSNAANNLSSFFNLTSPDLGEPGTPKCCKTSVNTECTSAKNEGRTLRSGRVLVRPLSAPVTGGNKRMRTPKKTSNNRGLANEALSSTADLTSHENDPAVAGIAVQDKLQSHDSRSKGKKKSARRRQSKRLFCNFM